MAENDPFDAITQRGLQDKEEAQYAELKRQQAISLKLIGELIQSGQYVGETLRMDFREVTVQVHDHHRKEVGGIPHLSYLVASRIQHWKGPVQWQDEDSSVLLLRVLGSAPMPSDMMDVIVRSEAARRATGNDSSHWEAIDNMDGYTRHQLSFAGLKCEVVGTFYISLENGQQVLRFGTDISNFYPNSGLKVYKPIDGALHTIVNFRDTRLSPEHPLDQFVVEIGGVRYASTNRLMQGVDGVPVSIAPVDMLAQRTALFGMSRTGKSNTTKIIARAMYQLRNDQGSPTRIGQLIFDYNGEYANENTQGGADVAANALRNVWRERSGNPQDVATYGLTKPQTDKGRKLLQVNAFGNRVGDWGDLASASEELDMLMIGKNILDELVADDTAKYMQNFVEVDLSVPDNISDPSKQTRYRRTILAYRALLKKAGLEPPSALSKPEITGLRGSGLFSEELLEAMRNSSDEANQATYAAAAKILDKTNAQSLTWDKLASALETLAGFISTKASGYKQFEDWYISRPKGSGEPWADPNLARLLEMFRHANGSKSVARLAPYHEPSNQRDFATEIYDELLSGALVIVDQSGGDPALNEAAAKRIMWKIFKGNQSVFTSGNPPKDILIYVEEAHNLLPPSKADDLKDVWVRTAKEGSKYRIGLLYATQEVSSIQKNILKNTANWFIAHLNNTDETRELKKFYDFAHFEDSILKSQDRGFLRVKMLSNPYINPVQIQRFVLNIESGQ